MKTQGLKSVALFFSCSVCKGRKEVKCHPELHQTIPSLGMHLPLVSFNRVVKCCVLLLCLCCLSYIVETALSTHSFLRHE